MRAPRGFGRNYFSLAAIQAYSSAAVLNGRIARTEAVSAHSSDRESETEPDEASPEELACALQQAASTPASGSCHCNCHFRRKTRNIIKNHPLAMRFLPPFRLTNSTLSPPKRAKYITY